MAAEKGIPPLAKFIGIASIIYFGGKAFANYQKQHDKTIMRNLQLRITGVHLEGPDIMMNVEVLNPNSENFDIQSFVGSMLINQQTVGAVQMFGDYIVKSNNRLTIPMVVRPKLVTLVRELKNAFTKKGALIVFAGTMNVNNHPIPLTMKYTL